MGNIYDSLIIGGGISGHSVAAYLTKAGKKVKLLEKEARVGGTMQTVKKEGYLIDYGPNTVVLNNANIFEMIEFGGLNDEMCRADSCATKRFVLKNAKLELLPMSPPAFVMSKLFSLSAKLRLLKEPFIGKGHDGETVADFVKRRLGDEFFNYAVDPFISGVYAGDPHKLSIKWAVPKIHVLEVKYGGLIKGLFLGAKERKQRRIETGETDKTKARLCNFKSGIAAFPAGIAGKLGDAVELNSDITGIDKDGEGYKISYNKENKPLSVTAKCIVLSVPTGPLDKLMHMIDKDYNGGMAAMSYAPVSQVFLGYKRPQVGHSLDGFGFLCPQKENRKILGALMNASMFPGRAPEGHTALTCFVGGMQHQELAGLEKEALLEMCHGELNDILGIEGRPVFTHVKRYPAAIPQYHLDYPEFLSIVQAFEKKHPGVYLSGNFRGGISLGDCMKQASETAGRVRTLK